MENYKKYLKYKNKYLLAKMKQYGGALEDNVINQILKDSLEKLINNLFSFIEYDDSEYNKYKNYFINFLKKYLIIEFEDKYDYFKNKIYEDENLQLKDELDLESIFKDSTNNSSEESKELQIDDNSQLNDTKLKYYLIICMISFLLFQNTSIYDLFKKPETNIDVSGLNSYSSYIEKFRENYIDKIYTKKKFHVGTNYDASSRLRRLGLSNSIYKDIANINMKHKFYECLYKKYTNELQPLTYKHNEDFPDTELIIQAISDIHEYHNYCNDINCDLFIIGGDIFYEQSRASFNEQLKYCKKFIDFLDNLIEKGNAKLIIITFGNHDFYFDYNPFKVKFDSAIKKIDRDIFNSTNYNSFIENMENYNLTKLMDNSIFNEFNNPEHNIDNELSYNNLLLTKFMNQTNIDKLDDEEKKSFCFFVRASIFLYQFNKDKIKLLCEGFHNIQYNNLNFNVFTTPVTQKREVSSVQQVLSGNRAFQIDLTNEGENSDIQNLIDRLKEKYQKFRLKHPEPILICITHTAIPVSFHFRVTKVKLETDKKTDKETDIKQFYYFNNKLKYYTDTNNRIDKKLKPEEFSPIYYDQCIFDNSTNLFNYLRTSPYRGYLNLGGHSHIPIEYNHLNLNGIKNIFETKINIKKEYTLDEDYLYEQLGVVFREFIVNKETDERDLRCYANTTLVNKLNGIIFPNPIKPLKFKIIFKKA